MKRKYLIFILLIVICGYFLFTYNYPDDLKINGNGTGLDLETELDMEKIKEEETQEVQEPKITTASILAVGDIMFHMPQNNAALNLDNKTYDFTNNFKYVKKYIQSADLSIANFETVVAEGRKYSGFPNFNSPIETLFAIEDAGFHILTTANNHCLDQGKIGLINTIDTIESLGMKNIGTYKSPDRDILIEDINEIKIGILAYCYGFNGMDYTLTEEERKYMISEIDEGKIKEDIEKAKKLDVDIVVVFIHWGHEYHDEPSSEQIELGRKMVEWGANIVLGSHPHVIQKSEIINSGGKDNFIIYSMGNFLSNQRFEIMNNKFTEDGIIVKIQVEKDFNNNNTTIRNIEYIPTWVRKYKIDNKFQYEILPIKDFLEDESLLNTLEEVEKVRIKESYQNTMNKMFKY